MFSLYYNALLTLNMYFFVESSGGIVNFNKTGVYYNNEIHFNIDQSTVDEPKSSASLKGILSAIISIIFLSF